MNPPSSKHRWFQFRLRTLLLLILLVAAGLGGWQYWRQTREMWRLQWAIAKYLPAESEEAKILTGITWDREAWDSGLVDALGAQVYNGSTVYDRTTLCHNDIAGVMWSGKFTDEGRNYRVLLYRGGIWEAWPLICLITDEAYRVEKWQCVSERTFGFLSATMDESSPAVLEFRCRDSSFLSARGYVYRITGDSIELVEEFECDYDPWAGTVNETFDGAAE
jgi:hypothetical protein